MSNLQVSKEAFLLFRLAAMFGLSLIKLIRAAKEIDAMTTEEREAVALSAEEKTDAVEERIQAH